MQRLVYSPKAYAFVKTDGTATGNPPYLDISDYIVNGRVNRVVGAASTASLTLRNPDKMFTQPGAPTFHPMDPITIYLSRYADRPVQVFTGYLDKTPYFQLYPGTMTLEASCTLKKLLYTYWDPALPFTMEFMAKYNWFLDGQTGQIRNLVEQAKTLDKSGLTDGSFAQVLLGVLTEPKLGNWAENEVFVEDLPANLVTFVQKLYNAFGEEEDELKSELEYLLKSIVGTGSYGSGGATQGGTDSTGEIHGEDKIVPKMVEISNKYNIPPEFTVAVWLIEWSGLKDTPGNPHYGYFQQQIANNPYSYGTMAPGGSIGIPTIAETHDLGIATEGFASAAAGLAKAQPGLRNDLYNWAITVQGVKGNLSSQSNDYKYPASFDVKVAAAKAKISKYSSSNPLNPGSVGPTIDQSTSSTRQGPKSSTTGTPKVFAPIAGGTTSISSPFGEQNHGSPPHTHMGIDVPVPVGTDCVAPADGKIGAFAQTTGFGGEGGMIHFVFTDDVGDIKAGTVLGWGHVSQVFFKPGDSVKAGEVIAKSGYPSAPHVHFIMRTDDGNMDGTTDPTAVFKALQQGTTAPTKGGSGGGSGSSSGSGGSDVLTNSTAAAFATELEWPSIEESIEAIALQGQKSLMNDKQLMPFIQQLTNATLRQFQSLPNGDFFAFFPDYFGAFNKRQAYWSISDIEILDGKIELSDDSLATHVYIVGDTGVPFDGVNFIDKILSGGVVTIFNAFNSEFVLSGDDKDGRTLLKTSNDALKFLQKYGARPYYEEAAFVRSPYFEMFLAFQKFQLLWSRTFLTEFTFTFMPELYPGGIVAFEDYGIQCYIDSVTHEFDYESGFTTTAELSAPAAHGDSDPLGISKGLARAGTSA